MKYKDKHTIRWQQKQDERTDTKSDRAIRRELKRNIDKFSIKVIKYVDSDWWNSLENKDREQVYYSWDKYIRDKYWRATIPDHNKLEGEFESWIKKMKSEVKPNTSLYRDKKLDRILNDN